MTLATASDGADVTLQTTASNMQQAQSVCPHVFIQVYSLDALLCLCVCVHVSMYMQHCDVHWIVSTAGHSKEAMGFGCT